MATEPKTTSKKKILEGSLFLIFAQVLPLFINLALTPFVIAGMGERKYGCMLIAGSLSAIMNVVDGGVGKTTLRFFARYSATGDVPSATRLVVTTMAALSVISAVLLTGYLLLADSILQWFKVPPEMFGGALALLTAFAIIAAVCLVRQPLQTVMMAHGRYREITAVFLLANLLYAGGLWFSVHNGYDLRGIAATYLVQQGIVTVLFIVLAKKHFSVKHIRFMTTSEFKDFGQYVWRIQLTSLFEVLVIQKDQLVVGKLVGAGNFAGFGQGMQFAAQFGKMPLQAQDPVQSYLGNIRASHSRAESVAKFNSLQREWVRVITVWFAVGIPAAYFGVAAWLPTLQEAPAVAAVALLANYFFLLPVVLRMWLLSDGVPAADFELNVAIFVVNIGLTVGLVFVLGPYGPLVATAASGAIGLLFMSRLLRRHHQTNVLEPWKSIPVVPAVVAAAVTCGLEFLVRDWLPSGGLGLLCAAAVGGPGVVLYAVWVLRDTQFAKLVWRKTGPLRQKVLRNNPK